MEAKIEKYLEELKVLLLNSYDIICCTTRVLQTYIFSKISFDFAIVDEATQCFEADIVSCLLKNIKHLILVGDIHQLGPVIKSRKAKQLGLEVTTIERLQGLGVPLTFLDTQYRMQPFLSEFSSKTFYQGRIKNGKVKPSHIIFPEIVQTHGFFYHIDSKEEPWSSGSSIQNKIEAQTVINVVKYLKDKNIENHKISVITFYAAQREYLKKLTKDNNLGEFEIMSVDESQGREKDYIILSCVRSNDNKSVGFLDNYRRLNVALTRVKNGLVVCGNADALVGSKLWRKLIYFFQERNAIFTGSMNNMKAYKMNLSRIVPTAIKSKKKFSKQIIYNNPYPRINQGNSPSL